MMSWNHIAVRMAADSSPPSSLYANELFDPIETLDPCLPNGNTFAGKPCLRGWRASRRVSR